MTMAMTKATSWHSLTQSLLRRSLQLRFDWGSACDQSGQGRQAHVVELQVLFAAVECGCLIYLTGFKARI